MKGATHTHTLTPRGRYQEKQWTSSIARFAAMVPAFRYSRLSPIAAANVVIHPGKPLILLFGGPGRTGTSDLKGEGSARFVTFILSPIAVA